MENQAETSDVYISRASKFNIGYDSSNSIHIVTLRLKEEIKGVSCRICKTPIKGEKYFCSAHKTFMHKDCCLNGHETTNLTNYKNPEHFDYLCQVNVEIEE